MEKNSNKYLKLVIAVVATAFVTYGGMRLLGYHPSHPPATVAETAGDGGKTVQKRLWTCGMHPWIVTEEPGRCPICGMDLVPKRDDGTDESGGPGQHDGERKVLYWRAPMNPSEIYDKPGKSAMGMDLVPVYEDEVQGGVAIKIDPVVEQNMGVRTAAARIEPLVDTIRTYGHIAYDETKTAQVSSKVNGWLEKLYVDFTGEHVNVGDPLFEIYSPELTAAQEEYLGAVRRGGRLGGAGENSMLESARRRLLYFDVAQSEIQEIEKEGEVRKTVLIRSPFTGIVTMKNATEGAFVKAGQTVYEIADLSTVWLEAHIYEYELGWIRNGLSAEMTLPYRPGRTYEGEVSFIYPYLQRQTRDVRVRLVFENPGLELKPDMYADVRIRIQGDGEGIAIPSEAVVRSGERNIVFVAEGNGRFTPREVALGMHLDGDKVQVLSGIAPGERVVTSGQFLLDSESKLKEAVAKMTAPKKEISRETPKKDRTGPEDFFEDLETSKKPGGNGQKDDFFEDLEDLGESSESAEDDFFRDLESNGKPYN